MSIESRWQLLPGPRPLIGFQSDWGRTSLSLHVANVRRRLWWSTGWGRSVPTRAVSSTSVQIAIWVILSHLMIMVNLYLFSWWLWLKFYFFLISVGWHWMFRLVLGGRVCWTRAKLSCTGGYGGWWGSDPTEEAHRCWTNAWSVCFSWDWSQNPYAAEVHFSFSFFSGSWDCLHCSETFIN